MNGKKNPSVSPFDRRYSSTMINGQFTYHVKNEVSPTATSYKTACKRIDRIIHDLFKTNEESNNQTPYQFIVLLLIRQRNCSINCDHPVEWMEMKNMRSFVHENQIWGEFLLWLSIEKTTKLIFFSEIQLSINFNVINILLTGCRLLDEKNSPLGNCILNIRKNANKFNLSNQHFVVYFFRD